MENVHEPKMLSSPATWFKSEKKLLWKKILKIIPNQSQTQGIHAGKCGKQILYIRQLRNNWQTEANIQEFGFDAENLKVDRRSK